MRTHHTAVIQKLRPAETGRCIQVCFKSSLTFICFITFIYFFIKTNEPYVVQLVDDFVIHSVPCITVFITHVKITCVYDNFEGLSKNIITRYEACFLLLFDLTITIWSKNIKYYSKRQYLLVHVVFRLPFAHVFLAFLFSLWFNVAPTSGVI